MAFYPTIATLIANLARTSRPESVWQELHQAAAKFGFTHLMVVETSGPVLTSLYSTFHDTTVDEVRAMPDLAGNPLVARAQVSEEPFVKSELPQAARGYARFGTLGLPSDFEAMEAVVVPVHEDRRPIGWICFARSEIGVDARTLHTLAVAGYAAWVHGSALKRHSLDKATLTPREVECLRLVANGLNDDQVGEILGITGRTVRFHVGNAKSKLGVRSRIQAISHLKPHDLKQTGLAQGPLAMPAARRDAHRR